MILVHSYNFLHNWFAIYPAFFEASIISYVTYIIMKLKEKRDSQFLYHCNMERKKVVFSLLVQYYGYLLSLQVEITVVTVFMYLYVGSVMIFAHGNEKTNRIVNTMTSCKSSSIYVVVHAQLESQGFNFNLFCDQELFEEVQKESTSSGTLKDEVNLMLQVMDMRRTYVEETSTAAGQKWKLPPSGQPVSLFGAPSSSKDDAAEGPIERLD